MTRSLLIWGARGERKLPTSSELGVFGIFGGRAGAGTKDANAASSSSV